MVIVTLVLIVGSSLFFYPDLFGPRWPWKLTPFNMRFLGAFYLAEMSAIVTLMLVNRWAPGRLVLPLSCLFTVVVSIVSVIHLDQFGLQRRTTWAWFVLYVGSALITGYFAWRYRRLPPANPIPPPQPWRSYLLGHGGIIGLYGLGLLFMPTLFSAFWPWPVDAFHAQVYSAIFLVNAASAYILLRAVAPIELFTLGLAQSLFGLCAILGTVIEDATAHRVDWSLLGTWLWIGAFAWLCLTGLAMMWQAQKRH
jgi:hypothetical protein